MANSIGAPSRNTDIRVASSSVFNSAFDQCMWEVFDEMVDGAYYLYSNGVDGDKVISQIKNITTKVRFDVGYDTHEGITVLGCEMISDPNWGMIYNGISISFFDSMDQDDPFYLRLKSTVMDIIDDQDFLYSFACHLYSMANNYNGSTASSILSFNQASKEFNDP